MVFFTIYSNFTLIPEFTFAKLQDFLLNWNLLFQFTILKQALEAHLRGEYALCVSSLATMWEGLIYIKANNATMQDRHRQKMGITKKALEDLTVANDYGQIFSDYFNNFIVSQCNTIDDVVDGVPNRHSVSHSWYRKYPSKKASLNAILLTDFILGLEPLENNQESA